ncbi:MAG: hypothetical protein RR543_05180 [Erysipelotrichales bacterium]
MDYLEFLKDMRTRRIMDQITIEKNALIEIIEHTRYCASAVNQQILRYAYFNQDNDLQTIFESTNLVKRHKIETKNRPSAFIVIGTSSRQKASTMLGIDIGISIQTIREAAKLKGYDSICIMSFNKEVVKGLVKEEFYPECLIAIGKSSQEIRIVDSKEDVGYFRDEDNIHTLNKLTLDKLIVK